MYFDLQFCISVNNYAIIMRIYYIHYTLNKVCLFRSHYIFYSFICSYHHRIFYIHLIIYADRLKQQSNQFDDDVEKTETNANLEIEKLTKKTQMNRCVAIKVILAL